MTEAATLHGKNIHSPLLQGHSNGWKPCESSWPSGKPWETAAGWKLWQQVIMHPECAAPVRAGISPELGKKGVIWCELSFGKRALCLPAEPLQEEFHLEFHQPWHPGCRQNRCPARRLLHHPPPPPPLTHVSDKLWPPCNS